jgi:hypothetical protein
VRRSLSGERTSVGASPGRRQRSAASYLGVNLEATAPAWSYTETPTVVRRPFRGGGCNGVQARCSWVGGAYRGYTACKIGVGRGGVVLLQHQHHTPAQKLSSALVQHGSIPRTHAMQGAQLLSSEGGRNKAPCLGRLGPAIRPN